MSTKSKITKLQTLQQTKDMLIRVWTLDQKPASNTNLRDTPPDGLGKNDNAIRALRTPIVSKDFADFSLTSLTTGDLVRAKTVGELRDQIWDKIPAGRKIQVQ